MYEHHILVKQMFRYLSSRKVIVGRPVYLQHNLSDSEQGYFYVILKSRTNPV